MQRVFTKRQTIIIQAFLHVVITAFAVWQSFVHGIAPGWATGAIGAIAWVFAVWFGVATAVGVVLYGLNLAFYRVQVYRHGLPSEQFEGEQ